MAKQNQQEGSRFTLDDQEVSQVRYRVTLDKTSPEPAIESADIQMFKGRKEVAAFSGLTADEVEKLVGPHNKTNIESGVGASKRNQPKYGIAGKLEKENLISTQAISAGLDDKRVKPQATSNATAALAELDKIGANVPDKPAVAAARTDLDLAPSGNLVDRTMSREEIAQWVETDLQSMDKITDQAQLKEAAATMTNNAIKSTAYREALENQLAKHPAADTVTAMTPAQLRGELATNPDLMSYSRGRLFAELALDRAHEQIEAIAEERQSLNTIVARMENGLGRAAPQSEAETAEWAKLDIDALAKINDPERKQFATLVMAGVAEQKPEYLGALRAEQATVADQVEKAAKDQQLANDVTRFERDVDTGRGVLDQLEDAKATPERAPGALLSGAQLEKYFREIEDDTKPASSAGIDSAGATIDRVAQESDVPEVNSIEPDDEIEVVHPRIDDEVRRNVALMWLNRIRTAALESQPVNPPPHRGEPTAGDHHQSPAADTKPTVQPVPKEIEDAYLRVGNKFHYAKKPDLQAFEDKGTKLETKSSSEQIAADLVKIAHARGWEKIKVTGTEEFRQRVWLEASLQGIKVKGYTPTEADKALLEKRERENPTNAIQREDQPRQDRTPSPTLEKAVEAPKTPAKAPSSAERATATAQGQQNTSATSTKADTPARDNPKELAGTLLEHGDAKYNFDKDEKLNYYVKYRDSQGAEKIAWGVGLKQAMRESGAQIGQHIEMKNLGKEEVIVNANVRDAEGKVVGKQEIVTHRNKWEVKAEVFRTQDPKEAVKEHPDLVNAYAVMRAAEIVAAQKFKSTEDQQRFVGMTRETLAKQIEQNREIPQVRIKEREQVAEHRREVAPAEEAER